MSEDWEREAIEEEAAEWAEFCRRRGYFCRVCGETMPVGYDPEVDASLCDECEDKTRSIFETNW